MDTNTKYLGVSTDDNDLFFTNDEQLLKDAVVVSLFTWRRSNDGDLPTDAFRYGWWADTYNSSKIGSRLYLLPREKITDDLIPKIDSICHEALQWLIDDGVVSEILITSARIDIGTIGTSIVIVKNSETVLSLDFSNIWKQYQ